MPKNLLILRASKDVCDVEIDQITAVAKMHNMSVFVQEVSGPDSVMKTANHKVIFDYIYLATHANPEGFGDDGPNGYFVKWVEFAQDICPLNILNQNSVFLLACCRGGVKKTSFDIFAGCGQIQFVCGPRWKLTAPDLTAGFHAFVYNMEQRQLQPDQAAKRASKATGYDFLCYDRIEIENTSEYLSHVEKIWGDVEVIDP